jgi:phosphonoacetaldehyde hydrolase
MCCYKTQKNKDLSRIAVAGDDVPNGVRPKPFMVYENMARLNVHPIQSVLKVDDTIAGVGEGLEAGCWTAGVARYSNYMDIDSIAHEATLSATEIADRLEQSRALLRASGAHYVVDDLQELPAVVDDINARLARGEQPA